VEEGVMKVFMKVFALLIIPIVHGIRIGLQGAGGVRVSVKGCISNVDDYSSDRCFNIGSLSSMEKMFKASLGTCLIY
jgi:hypothetical protein